MMRLKKLKTADLQVGMFVQDVGRGWLRHPWPTKSKLIVHQQEIKELEEHGINEVVVDLDKCELEIADDGELGISDQTYRQAQQVSEKDMVEKLKKPPPTPDHGAVERRRKPRPAEPLDNRSVLEEAPQAKQAYEKAVAASKRMLTDVQKYRQIKNFNQIEDQVNNLIDSVFRNRDALVSLLKLKSYDEYTFTHSINVAALSLSVGRQMNLDRGDLFHLGMGAMFHDLGKMIVPEKILNKPGKLSDQEFEVMKKHPALGAMVLAEQNHPVPEEALDVINHHHERIDGSGYPDRLSGEVIPQLTSICAISDVYDALSSERPYKKKMRPYEALKIVFQLRGQHFSPEMVERFIQSVGVYPAGSVLQLTSDEVGVVVEVNHACLIRPKIRLLRNPMSRRLDDDGLLDLNHPDLAEVQIKHVLNPEQLGVDPAKYFKA